MRKRKFWGLEHATPARIIGLGNARATEMSLEIAHVSLFAAYGDLEVATNTNIFHGYDLWGVSW